MDFRSRDYLDLTATQHALLFPEDEPVWTADRKSVV